MPPADQRKTKAPFATRSRWWRMAIALSISLVALAALVLRWYVDRTTETVDDGTTVVSTITDTSPTLTSAAVLLAVLLIVSLLLPDLSELNVFGVGLKLRVEAAQAAAKTATEETGRLKDVVQELRLEITRIEVATSANSAAQSGANASTNVTLVTTQVREYANELPPSPDLESEPTSRDSLTGRVINQWSEFVALLGLTPKLTIGVNLSKDDANLRSHRARVTFVEDHFPEIRAARDLRNIAAHSSTDLSLQELREGVDLLARLLDRARGWLESQNVEIR